MTAWDDALAKRADLAKRLAAGTAKTATAFECIASVYGGERETLSVRNDVTGYKGEDLRRWAFPDPFAVAELSTNYADAQHLDFRALIMQVPLAQRRLIMAARVDGDPATGLPHRWPMRITYNAHSFVCGKLDIGGGGPGINGLARAVDLWWQTSEHISVVANHAIAGLVSVTIEVALP